MRKRIEKVKMVKVDHERKETFDFVSTESVLNVYLNGEFVESVTCTAENAEYLGVGLLASKGFVTEAESVKVEFPEVYVKGKRGKIVKRKTFFSLRAETLKLRMEELLDSSQLFFQTGAYHLCGLLDAKKEIFIFVSQDISRHASVEKCVGFSILNKKFTNLAIFLSGRIDREIVKSCAVANVEMIVSKGAVTYEAIRESEEKKIALVGFVRNRRFNLYTCFDRIL